MLRADLHRLFERGYLTFSNDLHLNVSSRLREDYDNGRTYYPLNGKQIHVPGEGEAPAREFLEWHQEQVFKG